MQSYMVQTGTRLEEWKVGRVEDWKHECDESDACSQGTIVVY